MSSWERIYTINDFHDCPRLGIADFNGKPHVYQSRFDPVEDDWSEEYYVAEISAELFGLVWEDWQIWLRWRAAFNASEAGIETHPALPSERARHEELRAAIGDRLSAPPRTSAVVKARFRNVTLDGACGEVQWLVE